jgi:cell division protein ZapA (FtsZ GTPase activity inhibitor)
LQELLRIYAHSFNILRTFFGKEANMKEKFYVEIGGVKLGIVSEDGAEYVTAVANAVNDKINAMVAKNRNCSLLEAALFCALDSYSSGEGDAKKVKNLEAQIALYQANVNRLKKENEELRAKLQGNG